MKRLCIVFFALTVLLVFSRAASADLVKIGTAAYHDIGGETLNLNLIFEGELGSEGLVWLDYTHTATEWSNQDAWAENLFFNDWDLSLDPMYSTTIDFSSGWRLPDAGDDPQVGYDQTTSELGHLYYESLGANPFGSGSPFEALDAGYYWAAPEIDLGAFLGYGAWAFSFGDGYQWLNDSDTYYYGLAVHTGEVSAASEPVPEPATMLLLGSGIAGIGIFRRQRAGRGPRT